MKFSSGDVWLDKFGGGTVIMLVTPRPNESIWECLCTDSCGRLHWDWFPEEVIDDWLRDSEFVMIKNV